MTLLISVRQLRRQFGAGYRQRPWGKAHAYCPIRYLCNLYTSTFIRGTPLIMQILLFFYIIGTAWGIENRFHRGCADTVNIRGRVHQ